MSMPQSATKRSNSMPRPPGMLPCMLPPYSDDEYGQDNDENDPGICYTPRSDLDEDDLPMPVAPPLVEAHTLYAAQPFNHGPGVESRTPPRRHHAVGKVRTPTKQNGTNALPPRTKMPRNANVATRSRRQNGSSNGSIGSSQSGGTISDGELHENRRRRGTNGDGYDSDNLRRTAIARPRQRIATNSLRKKAPAFASVSGPLRKEGSVMEKLFGDVVNPPDSHAPASQQTNAHSSQYRQAVTSRMLVPSSLYLSDTTNLWIVTIDTNNGGWKTETPTLQAFSFPTLEEAREAAYSYAPPKVTAFEESPTCFICHGKFALFRRASHCRSCGVCVCNECRVQWPAKRLPQTYNHKREGKLNVCLSCNDLSEKFQSALCRGDEEETLALYETGNVNLRCPFGKDTSGEVMFPVHCAVVGENLYLVRWLVDVHFCPIFMTHMANSDKKVDEDSTCGKLPLLTSKGRSALNLAMSTQQLDIIRYLVVEKGMSIFEMKDLRTSLMNLELALTRLPPQANERGNRLMASRGTLHDNVVITTTNERGQTSAAHQYVSTSPEAEAAAAEGDDDSDDDATVTTVNDACIVCFENTIDCVMTPCGHQLCCMKCSKTLSLCPICNTSCSFLRIFKP